MTQPTKSSLAPVARRLVEEMQRINYGRIEGLRVCGGLPVLDPKPRIVHETLLSAAPSGRSADTASDFNLKPVVMELFQKLSSIGDGVILTLVVKNGLPHWLEIEE